MGGGVLKGNVEKRRFSGRGGLADVPPAGLTILAEEARNLADVNISDVTAEIETTRLKLLELGSDDTKHFSLQEHIAYLEGLRAALAN